MVYVKLYGELVHEGVILKKKKLTRYLNNNADLIFLTELFV
jgi:hypothetical protein